MCYQVTQLKSTAHVNKKWLSAIAQSSTHCISRAELCLARLVNIGIEQAQPELE
jgi:hypothetical protein